MAKVLVNLIVFLFFAGMIEGSLIRYVSEEDLIADPNKYRLMNDGSTYKLEDIACQSNGISIMTIFGRAFSLFLSFDNIDGSEYYQIYIYDTKAEVQFSNATEPLNRIEFNENPLNMSEFIQIEIQLQFGAEFRIKVSLPNGVELAAVDKRPISIATVFFGHFRKWYYSCPPLEAFHTVSDVTDSETVALSTDQITGDTVHLNKANNAAASFWQYLNSKIIG